ncbi:RNA-binding domain-containing protein [Annulohypoxylon truncatum]|uniref:RNA-binding domain-containing protein n=1 Tax=Annulohypoxylon truncatum TaxID=327061 RepID=UPI0020089091|nr:RNA-binding domain-containing protein [Annulohypoxylon truncatum]KAI1205154.1 RNA-binding domain-containing protein [Annulohypoxylon truncatum]
MATAVATEMEPESPSVANETHDLSKKRKSQIDEIEVDLSLPEPPSKKAKRLLKKGKPLPVKPNSDDEAESEDGLPIPKTKGDVKGAKGDKKSQRTEHGVWIGNLPFTLTRVELFKWLVESSGGAIKEENITRVNMPTSKDTGRDRRNSNSDEPAKRQNKGFAYVDFDAESASVAALALTETEINGRKLLIKDSKSYEGRPKKEASGENGDASSTPNGATKIEKNNPTSRKIYVGNLSFQTTEDDLRAHFDKCGEIEWIKVATFEDSGKCKGFGWVKFKEAESASWAVKGFVKIKEEIETEDDFRDDDEDVAGEKERKFKMRKWWVNRLKGRELKIESAEDDQVRYKKRFGKDAPAGKTQGKRDFKRDSRTNKTENGNRPAFGEKTEGAAKTGYGDAATASYLTGAVVKPQGKKITFD